MSIEREVQVSYKGYDLYSSVSDRNVQIHNRGAVMANILEEHSQGSNISPRGLSLILGYFEAIPAFDRQQVQAEFKKQLINRGLTNG